MSAPPTTYFPAIVLADPPYAPPWLLSFHIWKFLAFLAATLAVGYPLYRVVAVAKLGWEGHPKTPAMHFSDLMNGIGYGFFVFIGGNYSNTLNWITLAAFVPSLFLFGWIAEAPFLRHSFATIRSWSAGMYITVAVALAAILAAVAYLIRLAYTLRVDPDGTQSLLGWYLVAMLVPAALLLGGSAVAAWQNKGGWPAAVDGVSRRRRRKLRQNGGGDSVESGAAAAGSDASAAALADRSISSSASSSSAASSSSSLPALPPRWQPVKMHPHHWAIFYTLAFFTRFDDPVSNVAAGIVLGSYIHGIAAYGYADMLET